ncbi:MAG: hypothetical protein FJX68_18930 [Alphaproteobacteria bacterium]|nr:hypothetical protein [Alphaproteobacteria bacterium]
MYVKVDREFRATLADPTDFKKFHVEAACAAAEIERLRQALRGIARVDSAEAAWVSQAWLRGLPELQHDRAFQDGLTAMIEKARPHGWIDAATGAIKAHVKFLA